MMYAPLDIFNPFHCIINFIFIHIHISAFKATKIIINKCSDNEFTSNVMYVKVHALASLNVPIFQHCPTGIKFSVAVLDEQTALTGLFIWSVFSHMNNNADMFWGMLDVSLHSKLSYIYI